MKVKLGEVFENVINGDWGDEPTGNNDVAVIRTTNFTNDGIINYNNVVCRQIKNDAVLKKKLIYGDIIIEKSGGSDNFPVGRVVYYDRIDEIYLCNNFTSILRVNKKLVDSKYLLYLMLNLYNKGVTTKFQNKTTGIRNLQLTSYLANTEINIHDIQTQKEIVAVLDKVTLLISMRKEQLEKLDILVKSKFIEMFGDPVLNPKGWEKKKLGEVCNVVVGGDVPLDNFSKEKNEDYNIPIYSNGLAENMLYGYTNNARIQQPCVTVSARGTIGYCFPHFKPFYPIVRLLCVIPSNNFSILFLCHQINSINIKSSGSGVAQLTSPMIKSCALIIPPLDLQNQFAEFVEQVEKNKENIKSSLNQLETLYSALMQEYFG